MTSVTLYFVLIVLTALERLVEVGIAKRNAKRALAQGGREYGASHYPYMVALHTAFLVSCTIEVSVAERAFLPGLGWSMLALVFFCQFARYHIIATLKDQWNTRVITFPNRPLVRHGLYKWLKHPNYLIVVIEIAALPLVHSAYVTALVFSVANAVLLSVRIKIENLALAEAVAGPGDHHLA